nr:biosynthetic peptidoglycan transglycosylase [Candidatus Nitrospira nitrificans]
MDARQKSDHSPTFLRHYTYDPPPPKSTGRRRVTRVLLWSTALIGLPLGLLVMGWLIMLPDTDLLAKTNPTSTALMDARQAQATKQRHASGRQWMWVPLSRISPHLRHAVVAAEDASFFTHEGFDWEGMKEAAKYNLEAGEFKRGGSTITQQLAKNLYLSSERSLFRKAREALITRSLEQHLTKKRILELYLNVAEWGARHLWRRSCGPSSLREVGRGPDDRRSCLAGGHFAVSTQIRSPSENDLPHSPPRTYSKMDRSAIRNARAHRR